MPSTNYRIICMKNKVQNSYLEDVYFDKISNAVK